MVALNFANPDKSKVARNLIISLNYRLKEIIRLLEEYNEAGTGEERGEVIDKDN